jgi:hypothetical protein
MRKHSQTAILNSLTSQDLRTLSTCPVPIHAVVNREIDRDGHREHSVLLDTAPILEPWPLVRNIGCAPALKSDIDS